jgi:hypothetical protein
MFHIKLINKLSIALLLGISSIAVAQNSTDLNKFLDEFHADPKGTMNKVPKKVKKSEKIKQINLFSEKDISSQNFIEKKDEVRSSIMKNSTQNTEDFSPLAEYQGNDNPQNLIDNTSSFVNNIKIIDSQNLQRARLPTQPWSSSYWPLYKGSIADRYADKNASYSNFDDYIKYMETNPANTFIANGKTDLLSPAEKYDLLMNDRNFTLTNSIISDLKRYSKFEGWEGICHGWSPASYMYKRPIRSVNVTNADGIQVTFHPDDIKALSSLMWANLGSSTKFVGGRCNQKNPAEDANGRVLSQECFDTNPGSFHLALVNQIGISKRGFVFDATYDYQVWNQPIVAYSYYYFNPQTRSTSYNSADVMINKNDYTSDKFKDYRTNRSTSLVGVVLNVEYIAETWPTGANKDSPSNDGVVSVQYIYDLEVDANGNIIGGEWYQKAHPDFMWTPTSNADVTTGVVPNSIFPSVPIILYKSYTWYSNPTQPSRDWLNYSILASKWYRTPLENIVRSLNAWASVDNPNEVPENCTQPCVPSKYTWRNN